VRYEKKGDSKMLLVQSCITPLETRYLKERHKSKGIRHKKKPLSLTIFYLQLAVYQRLINLNMKIAAVARP
jgi:hypothetical protein